jgi:hypothetical protein
MPNGSAVRSVRPWNGTSGNDTGRLRARNQAAARSMSSSLASLNPSAVTVGSRALRSTTEW